MIKLYKEKYLISAMDIRHTEDKFFVTIDGKEAFLLYRISGNAMDIYDTFTPSELRGRGIAEQLALAAFKYAKENNLRIIPTCPYISDTFLKRHPELLGTVKKGTL